MTDAMSDGNSSRGVSPTNKATRVSEYPATSRKLVLCFDGTGNKFRGDDSDSNILKIFRMLDSSVNDQFHYYQPGIGTYLISENLSQNGLRASCSSWYKLAKDSAVGSSFDQHVVGGYRFLMRYYSHGDEIYMFGFSRGAYVARFLAEMLDYVGLLAHGNEEMVAFAWNSFSQWQCRRANSTPDGQKEKKAMYKFLKSFRETFSRPVRRIRFLGLFDTVNSVPRFETAWMQRSKFPYTARSSAKVVRHAVSIDERRAKFRQDLIYQGPAHSKKKTPAQDILQEFQEKYRPGRRMTLAPEDILALEDRGRRRTHQSVDDPSNPAPYRSLSRSKSRATNQSTRRETGEHVESISIASGPPVSNIVYDSEDEDEQDVDEVWFAGGHGDVGGGWDVPPNSKSASHIPLAWMVREAVRAGLTFDAEQLAAMGCVESATAFVPVRRNAISPFVGRSVVPEIQIEAPSPISSPMARNEEFPLACQEKGSFDDMLRSAHVATIHDALNFSCGSSPFQVFLWRVMEYLPFRRLDLRPDGTWKPIRWPLPGGEVRDIPDKVRVHGSVIRRMKLDPSYRPGNLIVGGGGRGCRVAPQEFGTGEWVCVSGEGDPIDEIWVRKGKDKC